MVTILVVDDERNVRFTWQEILSSYEYQVLTAENAIKALDLIHTEKIDVIISDFCMPKMNGYEFFSQVKENWPSLAEKFIFVSGGCKANQENMIRQQGIPFFSKPISNKVVKKVIDIISKL